MDQQPQPQPQQKSWFGRNLKWIIPLGCVTPLVLCCGFFGIIFTTVFGLLKSSEPYQHALSTASGNPQVQQALGEPIEAGFFPSGNINIQNNTGEADLTIPIQGPQGSGSIRVIAEKDGGPWEYSTLRVDLDDGEQIDLLAE